MNLFSKGRIVLQGAVLLSFLLICPLDTSTADTSNAKESRYTIYSKGLRVGNLKTVYSLLPGNNKKVLKFESVTRIDADFIVYSYALDSKEEAFVGDEGTFRYNRTTRENDTSCEVDGRLENGRFHFDIRENGVRRSLTINKDQYDYTTMECPEISMKKEGDEMSLRLLDLEHLAVVTRKYRWVKSEDVKVDGKSIRCRVIDFEDPNKKGRRWIRKDDVGVTIARQDGKGKGGSYSLKIATLTTRP
ncbi:MAG: hypothetical protein FD174_1689 [Geobacteraceae bacterium]|nr:MAG: hypothetical protein FD174_1689 [Geobacteraceae bacterium]